MKKTKKAKKKRNRATFVTKIQRKLKMEDWLRQGFRKADIFRFSKGWGVGPDMIEKMITEINKEWKAFHAVEQPHIREQAIETRWKLFRQAKDAGEFSTAARILDSIARINGTLFEHVKVEDISSVSKEELEALAKTARGRK